MSRTDDPHAARELASVSDALRAAGIDPTDLGRFGTWEGRRADFDHKRSVPLLLAWLARVAHPGVKQILVRHLSTPHARGVAVEHLLTLFEATPNDQSSLKWAIGNALDTVTTRKHVDRLLPLALDRSHGRGRQMIVYRLSRLSGDERIVAAMRELAGDPEVCLHAMSGVRRLFDPHEAVAYLEELLEHEDAGVRATAKRELTKARKKLRR